MTIPCTCGRRHDDDLDRMASELADQVIEREVCAAVERGITQAVIGHMTKRKPRRPDFAAYYYYPRNVQDPDRAMAVIAKHVKKFTQG